MIDLNDIADGAEEEAQRKLEGVQARRLEIAAEAQQRAESMRNERDIVKRARLLASTQLIDFPDVKKVRQGDSFITQPLMTDQNKWRVLDALFEGQDEHMPHRDHYRGRIVDHEGKIIDDHYSVVRWVSAFSAAGLKGVGANGARDAIREWALQHERNDLINNVESNMPEWDGKERMRRFLIEFFESHETPLNEDFGQYFWLSLYNRVMIPGSLAPMVLSLFGAQGCGKSLFGKRLCQILTGNEEADSVQLNLDGEKLEFLRNITGNSVIASVGEMTGFTRGDLNKIKDFITRSSDQMHYKFEGNFTQLRQWITVMDGNKYEGLQRDDSGNRRFYPMFCGQLPDKLGRPDWRPDFVVEADRWASLEGEVWQIMAEAAKWMDDNGEHRYNKFVSYVINQVRDFSNAEMARDSGTIQDDVFDVYLVPMLKEGPKLMWRRSNGEECVGVKAGEFKRFFQDRNKHLKPNWRHLKHKMLSLGAIEHAFSGGYPGYLFPQFKSVLDFEMKIGEKEYTDDGSIVSISEAIGGGGGGF